MCCASVSVSPFLTPINTRRPAPISYDVVVDEHACRRDSLTTALNAGSESGRGFVLETGGHTVTQFPAWVEARVEQVSRHHVPECLEHRLLDAGMLDFEIHDEPLDALGADQVAACRAAAADDRQADLLAYSRASSSPT